LHEQELQLTLQFTFHTLITTENWVSAVKEEKEQEVKARLPKLRYVLKFTKETKGKQKC
jgi:hypothetical protein